MCMGSRKIVRVMVVHDEGSLERSVKSTLGDVMCHGGNALELADCELKWR